MQAHLIVRASACRKDCREKFCASNCAERQRLIHCPHDVRDPLPTRHPETAAPTGIVSHLTRKVGVDNHNAPETRGARLTET